VSINVPPNPTQSAVPSAAAVLGAPTLPDVARADAARWRVLLPCVAAAIAGTLLTVEAWYGARLREDRLAELELNARSEDYRSVLQTGIDDYIGKIEALQALFGAIPNVSRPQFLDYAHAILGGHPAIIAVSWVPRVTHAERAQHERAGEARATSITGSGCPNRTAASWSRRRRPNTSRSSIHLPLRRQPDGSAITWMTGRPAGEHWRAPVQPAAWPPVSASRS
jgi:CHASE domain